MIKPLNHHYSFENPASVYDEEAMTALELAGRTTYKVNECVEQVNRIPETVSQDVQGHINKGEFDRQIARYAGDLDKRVDNLLGSVTQGSTTGDAELIDIRTGNDGHAYTNAGDAVRAQMDKKMDVASSIIPGAHTNNLLNEDAIIHGYFYLADTGEYAKQNTACHYPLVPVTGNTLLSLFNAQIFTCFDANKNVISSESKASLNWVTVTTPANCAYVTVSKSESNTTVSGIFLGNYTGNVDPGANLIAPEQVEGMSNFMLMVNTDLVRRVSGKNQFDPNSQYKFTNQYMDADYGVIGPHNSYDMVYIFVNPNTTYTLSPSANYHVGFLGDGGVHIGGVHGVENTTFTTPGNCSRICLSYPNHITGEIQMEMGANKTPYEPYCYGVGPGSINYGAVRPDHLSESTLEMIKTGKKVVTIGPSGCDYTSILRALYENGEDTVFHVYPGDYEMVREYQEMFGVDYHEKYTTYMHNPDIWSRGWYLKPGCELIGIGHVILKNYYEGDNENVRQYMATLNTSYNNVVKNLWLTMGNRAGRYHIHDDFAVPGVPGSLHIQNVRMTGLPYLGTFIGSGMGTCNQYLIENCVCDTNEGIGIAYHNSLDAGRNRLIIRDCYLGQGSIVLKSYGASTEPSTILISGCKTSAITVDYTDQTNYPNNNMEVIEWNNTIG